MTATAVVGVVMAAAAAAAADGASTGSAAAPRFACIETAAEAELRLDLGAGEGGVWRGELTLTTVAGTSELGGTAYDMSKAGAKGRKPPKLRLKPKPVSDAQRAEALQALTIAAARPEQGMDCDSPVPQSVKLSWTCASGNQKTGGELSFEGDRCGPKTTGYVRAVGIADWAATLLKRHGAR